MKMKARCPACGTPELTNMFITTFKGKRLTLQLSSQNDIRKSTGDVCCVICGHVGYVTDFQKKIDNFDAAENR